MENAQLKMKSELLARRAAQKIPMEKKSECARGVGDATSGEGRMQRVNGQKNERNKGERRTGSSTTAGRTTAAAACSAAAAVTAT